MPAFVDISVPLRSGIASDPRGWALGSSTSAIRTPWPPEWCFQPGVKLDFRDQPDGYVVTPDDIDAELNRIGHTCARWRSSW